MNFRLKAEATFARPFMRELRRGRRGATAPWHPWHLDCLASRLLLTALALAAGQAGGAHEHTFEFNRLRAAAAWLPPRPSHQGDPMLHVTKAITIMQPADTVYRYWRDFSNLPNFMAHVQSVATTGDRRSHWVVSAPAGQTVEWDAEIVEDRAGRAHRLAIARRQRHSP